MWKLNPGEEEFTVMRIRIKGIENVIHRHYEYYVHENMTPGGAPLQWREPKVKCTLPRPIFYSKRNLTEWNLSTRIFRRKDR